MNVVRPNTTAATTAAAADKPEQQDRARRRDSVCSSHSLVLEVQLRSAVGRRCVVVSPRKAARSPERRRDRRSTSDHASAPTADEAPPAPNAAAATVAVTGAAGAMVVAVSTIRLRCAISAAPSAAVSCGCGVVTTVVRRCSESRWVISGMRAPPPTVATAEMLASGTRLRSSVSTRAATNSASGSGDQVVELHPGHPDGGLQSGQVDDDGRGRLGRQPFLGAPALVAQPGERSDHRGARRVGVGASKISGDDLGQDRLVDVVTREVGHADRLADGSVLRRRVDQRDAGAAAAEVAQHDHARRRQARDSPAVPSTPRRRRRPLATELSPGLLRSAARSASTTDGPPVRGHRHRHLRHRRPVGCTAGHAVERLGQQHLRAVLGTVLGDHRNGIANAVDEPGERHAAAPASPPRGE